MKYTVDTTNKTIEIQSATSEEIIELAGKYPEHKFIMEVQTVPYYVPQQPYTKDWGLPTWVYPYSGTSPIINPCETTSSSGTLIGHCLTSN